MNIRMLYGNFTRKPLGAASGGLSFGNNPYTVYSSHSSENIWHLFFLRHLPFRRNKIPPRLSCSFFLTMSCSICGNRRLPSGCFHVHIFFFWTSARLSSASTSNPPLFLAPFGLPPCIPLLQRPIHHSISSLLDFCLPFLYFNVQS